mgnify:FL=1
MSVDTRRVRGPKSIAKTSPISDISETPTDASRFAVCTNKSIYVFETKLRNPIAERSLTSIKGHNFTAACPIGSRYLLAASQKLVAIAKPAQPPTKGETPRRRARQTALLLYDLRTDLPPQKLVIDNVVSVSRLGVSPDGSRVFGACGDGNMFFVPIRPHGQMFQEWSTSPFHSWPAHHRKVSDFVWVSDRKRLATVSDDGTCAIWNFQSDPLHTFPSSNATSHHRATSTGAEPLVLGQRLHISSGAVRRITATSGGDRIATVGDDRVIRVWDTKSGLELISLEPRKENVASIEFSPDDRYLMVAEANSRIDVIQLLD